MAHDLHRDLEAELLQLERQSDINHGSVTAIQDEWIDQFRAPGAPDYRLTPATVNVWLKMYAPACISEAFRITAKAFKEGRLNDLNDSPQAMEDAVRYASGCMKQIAQKARGGA